MKFLLSIFFSLVLLAPREIHAQKFDPGEIGADSWKQVQAHKKGTVSVIWDPIDPFIYLDKDGKMVGVECEIMQSFVAWLKRQYGVDVNINWVTAGSFENIYPYIRDAKQPGLFGWSYFSITEDRKKEVQFSPPYMPDLNIVVTNNSMPVYGNNHDFIADLKKMTAYTMKATIMEADVNKLKDNFYPGLTVNFMRDDYKVLEEISNTRNGFGYVPLSIYISALQKGVKVKRQPVLLARREGFAAIMPKNSDWGAPITEYFNTPSFKLFANKTIKKYLGSEVSDLIFNVSEPDSTRTDKSDIELLTLEREIVTQRLVESAVQIQNERNLRSMLILVAGVIVIISIFGYVRIREKQKVNKLLKQRNEVILQQKEEIEKINNQLELKLMQARLNPHFVFNSMNAIQYFVGVNDRKGALNYISSFSRFLRQLFKNAEGLENTVSKEAEMLEQYLHLEKHRFENKFDFRITVQDTAELAAAEIPSMLVQSFVENALYHGVLNRSNGGGMICIRFEMQEQSVHIFIEDNGVGRAKAREIITRKGGDDLTTQKHFGENRIALLNKNRKEKIVIATADKHGENNEPSGTGVHIIIPVTTA